MHLFISKYWVFVVIFSISALNIYLFTILNAKEATVSGWDVTTSRNISTYIFPNSSLFYWKPDNFCERPVFLIFFVISTPSNFAARNAIRQSWASEQLILGKSLKTYFLLGETTNFTIQAEIEQEYKLYNDIIQGNFIDSYNNLTIKSVAMLNLVHTYCSNRTQYVMKCDDDTFVNTPTLVKTLSLLPKRKVLTGTLICRAKPIKDSKHKWYAPNYMFSEIFYPDYLSGSGYVFSNDVASSLYLAALDTPLFYLEDVYITGICAKKAKIQRIHNSNFRYGRENFVSCAAKFLITSHQILPKEMKTLFLNVKRSNVTNCKVIKAKKRRRCS